MPKPANLEFFIDSSRCIGCQACVLACAECGSHKGMAMIQLDIIDPLISTQSAPIVCMHCDSPTCAEVCPADAIKRTEDGIVQSALEPRCITCNNCVLACPFGVPKMNNVMGMMMKCDMCYDRSSLGISPMCASVCPSQALFFGTRDEIARLRPKSRPVNTFQFGSQLISTKVMMMVPSDSRMTTVDMGSALFEAPSMQEMIETDLMANMYSDEG